MKAPFERGNILRFTIVDRGKAFPEKGVNEAFLRVDYWNDYSFVTMFEALLYDEGGEAISLGSVKIGFSGQTTAISTYTTINSPFTELGGQYFSAGQDVKYYDVLRNRVSEAQRSAFLRGLRDVVFDNSRLETVQYEDVFRTSLLRYVSLTSIDGQFRRVLDGGVPLSDFDFSFKREPTPKMAGIELDFKVSANSAPSTNIHAIIGRNGVGKTTILNEMISAIMALEANGALFLANSVFGQASISKDYFSSLVSVGFSAFDPFMPPAENVDPSRGTRYSYIGLKDIADEDGVLLKSLVTLRAECVASIKECFSDLGRKERWTVAIETLESDENFAVMELPRLLDLQGDALHSEASRIVKLMSSGHAVVLLTISRLVSRVEEKTLVLIDEPESHLHPPLLSAFTRVLSELLHNRNGVAIVATHSPVVLQEIPKSCAYVMTRSRLSMQADRPQIETFGENVDSLTREVFGLEVTQSGFHALLQEAVLKGGSYDAILESYNNQLGQEGRGILRAMVANRDAGPPTA